MHLRYAHIEHVKGISNAKLDFDDDCMAGWHVILGDNGAGKSTLIRALAVGLVGPVEAMALREPWNRWIKNGHKAATVKLGIQIHKQQDVAMGGGQWPKNAQFEALFKIEKGPTAGVGSIAVDLSGNKAPLRYLWGMNRGWFSASFGPSRRFTGGDSDYQRVFFSNPRVARHLSAFSEQVALSEALMWLIERKRAGLHDWVTSVQDFINGSGLLPHEVTLDDVTYQTLRFTDGNGVSITADELSDGYRSLLSLALELLRQMEACYGAEGLIDPDRKVVTMPGVVLIDEIDAHLHPTWQASVGEWFVSRFPKVQFIVATHSALVCRSIGETGRVFRLRAPGETGAQLSRITGEERDKLWFGSLERALSSEGFGQDLGRSDYGWARVEELRALSLAARARDLTPGERDRLRHLRAVLADSPEVPR